MIVFLLLPILTSVVQSMPSSDSGGVCPRDGGVLLVPHDFNRDQYYYCENGDLTEVSCDPGTIFSFEKQACIEEDFSNSLRDRLLEVFDAAVSELADASQIDRLPNGCPVRNDIHQLLPHETNCTLFYYCIFGQKVERSCPRETEFNSVIQVCVTPDISDCSSSQLSDEEHKRKRRQIEYGTTTQKIVTLANGCPSDWSIHHLLPHETNCSQFYYCDHGEKLPTPHNCSIGTIFSYKYQVCVWPYQDQESCINGVNTTPDPGVTESTSSQTTQSSSSSSTGSSSSSSTGSSSSGTTEYPIGTTTEQIEILPNGCPSNWSIHHLLSHESNCSQFYYCENGRKLPTPHNCSAGTVFSFKYQVCVWPFQATENCTNGEGPNTEDPSSPSTEDPSSPSTDDPSSPSTGDPSSPSTDDPSSPSTDDPSSPSTDDPSSPSTDDPSSPSTDDPSSPSTDDPSSPSTDEPSSPSTDDPSSPSTDDPSSPSTDDPSSPSTDDPSSPSTDDPSSPSTDDPSSPSTDDPSSPSTEDPSSPSTDNPTSPTTDDPSNICSEICNVSPWAHTDCDKYWSCVGTELVLGACSPGLHFNNATGTCDFTCNAGCQAVYKK